MIFHFRLEGEKGLGTGTKTTERKPPPHSQNSLPTWSLSLGRLGLLLSGFKKAQNSIPTEPCVRWDWNFNLRCMGVALKTFHFKQVCLLFTRLSILIRGNPTHFSGVQDWDHPQTCRPQAVSLERSSLSAQTEL